MELIDSTIGIGELLRRIQQELIMSQKERIRSGTEPLFETESCEVEMKCIVKKLEKGSGKVDFKIIAVGGDEEIAKERIHTIKLNFKVAHTDKSIQEADLLEKPSGRRPRHE